jgi:iron complex transport system substrate-binding protein
MSFLNTVINTVEDEFVKEQLQDRVDIVGHKIKFMDKVPVVVLNADNQVNHQLDELLIIAGAELQQDPQQARVVIYLEPESGMLNLMGLMPSLLHKEWPAVEYNRLYLLEPLHDDLNNPAYLIEVLEDLAEMLYPGYFVFGNEGKSWVSFSV